MPRTYSETVTTPAAARASRSGARPFVSLLSDFGLRDPSAGIMRAVVAEICPRAIVVDLSHDVDKFAIRDGALLLWSAVPYLPIGAHVAVVDPGVGTDRKGVAIQTARGDYLVGPDNGLLMPAAARLGGISRAHLLENPRYSLREVSSSFHGRDVFAPAAAHLADGASIEELGRAVDPRRLLELEWPRPDIGPGRLGAQAIYLDTFGNVKLSALAEDLTAALPELRFGDTVAIRVGEADDARELRARWVRTFGDVPEGEPLLTVDSYGRVSLCVHQGSAVAAYGVRRDRSVEVSRAPAPSGAPSGTAPPPAPSGTAPPRAPLARPPAPMAAPPGTAPHAAPSGTASPPGSTTTPLGGPSAPGRPARPASTTTSPGAPPARRGAPTARSAAPPAPARPVVPPQASSRPQPPGGARPPASLSPGPPSPPTHGARGNPRRR